MGILVHIKIQPEVNYRTPRQGLSTSLPLVFSHTKASKRTQERFDGWDF
jgi:hypothetical protein